jgi:hypothetical protein
VIGVEFQGLQPRGHRRDRARGHRRDRLAAEIDRQGLGPQSRPLATGARRIAQPLFQPRQFFALSFGTDPLQPARQPDKTTPAPGSLPQLLRRLALPISHWLFGIDLLLLAKALQPLAQVAVLEVLPQRAERPLERSAPTGEDLLVA